MTFLEAMNLVSSNRALKVTLSEGVNNWFVRFNGYQFVIYYMFTNKEDVYNMLPYELNNLWKEYTL